MVLRNSSTGGVEVYDIRNNQLPGTLGLNWQFLGCRQFQRPRREPSLRLHRDVVEFIELAVVIESDPHVFVEQLRATPKD